MLSYNTRRPKLRLPEYGRNIQQMIDHCMTIPDRDERTRCAHTIIGVMKTLLPQTGDMDEYMRKLWDHLAIMSDFALDIDWPVEVIQRESLQTPPDPVLLPAFNISRRQYGKNLELMIGRVCDYPEGEERDVLAILLANQMKKMMVTADNDAVEDEKIFRDLLDMSHGVINLFDKDIHLHEFKTLPGPSKKKKKK